MYTKTRQVREERRKRAEANQVKSAARPLKEKILNAGAKELAKLKTKHGEETIKSVLEGGEPITPKAEQKPTKAAKQKQQKLNPGLE